MQGSWHPGSSCTLIAVVVFIQVGHALSDADFGGKITLQWVVCSQPGQNCHCVRSPKAKDVPRPSVRVKSAPGVSLSPSPAGKLAESSHSSGAADLHTVGRTTSGLTV